MNSITQNNPEKDMVVSGLQVEKKTAQRNLTGKCCQKEKFHKHSLKFELAFFLVILEFGSILFYKTEGVLS